MFSKAEIDSIFDEYNEITVSSTAKLSEIKTKDLTDSNTGRCITLHGLH